MERDYEKKTLANIKECAITNPTFHLISVCNILYIFMAALIGLLTLKQQ